MKNLIVLILMSFSLQTLAVDFKSPEDVPYGQRRIFLKKISVKYYGTKTTGFEYSNLGLWSGMYLQTLWQQESRRNRIFIWNIINAALTVDPYFYMLEYERNKNFSCKESPYRKKYRAKDISAQTYTGIQICEQWKQFFTQVDPLNKSSRRGAYYRNQAAMWKPHSSTILYFLERSITDEKLQDIPRAEVNFWSNWVATVHYLAVGNYPTHGALTYQISRKFNPYCSPLDYDGECRPSNLDGPEAKGFVGMMAKIIPYNVDELLYLYREEKIFTKRGAWNIVDTILDL